jgi:ketosteroid isomerase-like protein
MGMSKLDTVRAYYAASERDDDEAAATCVAAVPGFVWIDHQKGAVCRTVDEFIDAVTENAAWSGRTFDITNVMETTDGALIVQVTISGTLRGTWCHVTGQGECVSFDACVIFRFDDDGKIVLEEHYADALTVQRQLEASEPAA